MPDVFVKSVPSGHVKSIKYIGFYFNSNHDDDVDLLKQMRLLYSRSDRHVSLFNNCDKC